MGVRHRYTPYGELDVVDVGTSSESARGSELGYTGKGLITAGQLAWFDVLLGTETSLATAAASTAFP